MALVSRDSVVNAAEQMVSGVSVKVGVPNSPSGSTGAAPVPQRPQARLPQAAAVPTPPAAFIAVVGAFACVLGGSLAAYALWWYGRTTEVIHTPDTATTFVVLLVFAAAVERLLEPFTRWIPGSSAVAELEDVRAAVANRRDELTHADLAAVARAQGEAGRARASRAVLLWGLATAVATVFSTQCGFYLLHAIANPSWGGVPVWADALVTGLVVGSGTKPVHDLITMTQTKAG